MADKIFTVYRGTELMTSGRRLEELKSLAAEDEVDFEDIISIAQNYKLEHKYTGFDFSNSFNVNKKVILVGVGFYGPRYQEKAKYLVKVRIDGTFYPRRGNNPEKVTLASTEKEVVGFRGDIFLVDFDSPVVIDSSAVKYTIAFTLKGPETEGLDPTKMKTNVCSDCDDVQFYFWPGSQQMPMIRFKRFLSCEDVDFP